MAKFTTLDDRLTYLYALERKGIKVGLKHTEDLLARCGNPHHEFPSIHIAGTNGKGSTAAVVHAILVESGYKVGLYTSPHLVQFNERVRINGKPISDEDIVQFVDRYNQDFDAINSTFFETTTALAFWYFAEQKVDVAVIETGLGGRLDSTNVLVPEITVITPIDLDHGHILGNTILEIAKEKAGIIKPSIPLILAPQPIAAKDVIEKVAHEKNARLYNPDPPYDIKISAIGTQFKWHTDLFNLPLIGFHQATNTVLGMQTAMVFDSSISIDKIQSGLRNIRWPGRLQIVGEDPMFMYDVAHNGHGLNSLLQSLKHFSNKRPVGIMALKEDKEISGIASLLKNQFSTLMVTTEPNMGLMETKELKRTLEKHNVICEESKSIRDAVRKAKDLLEESQMGLIFGSHYIGKAVFEVFDFSFDTGAI